MAARPQLHFPSPYLLPTAPLERAFFHVTPDGAKIATYVYVPAASSLDQTVAQGKAPALLLHGNGEEHGIFGQVIDTICESGRAVVAIDSRAQGRSTRGTASLSYELMAGDALAVFGHLGVDAVHVVGFSDGAIEALIIGRDHPDRVLSILSIGANLTPDGVDDSFEMESASRALSDWADYWTKGEGAARNVDTSLLNPPIDQARITAELLHLMVVEPQIPAESLSAIACPTTVMAGEFDEIKREETELIWRSIPEAELVIVPGCGHTLPKEAPEQVAKAALATIARAERIS
ncbi:MAG: alpha/beta hydrolase [Olsenella sp.]|nr:alpha/beta hydrolase [Olsenella sp.]